LQVDIVQIFLDDPRREEKDHQRLQKHYGLGKTRNNPTPGKLRILSQNGNP